MYKTNNLTTSEPSKLQKVFFSQLKLKCPNNECEQISSHKDIIAHIEDCQYTQRIAVCAYCKERIKTTNLIKEIEAHIEACKFRLQLCKHCSVAYLSKDMESHVSNYCKKREIKCTYCGVDHTAFQSVEHRMTACGEVVYSKQFGEILYLKGELKSLREQVGKQISDHERLIKESFEEIKALKNDNIYLTDSNNILMSDNKLLNEKINTLSDDIKKIMLNSEQSKDKALNQPSTGQQISTNEPKKGIDELVKSYSLQHLFSEAATWISTCCLALLPNGNFLSGSTDGYITEWDTNKNCLLKKSRAHEQSVYTIITLPDGKIASCSRDRKIKIWDQSYTCIHTLTEHNKSVNRLLAINDTSYMASSDIDGLIIIWDGRFKYAYFKTLCGHTCRVSRLANIPNGFASSSDDTTIRLWDKNDFKCTRVLKNSAYYSAVYAILYVNGVLMSATSNNYMQVWDLNSGECLRSFQSGHWNTIYCMEALEGGYFATGSGENSIKIWDKNGCVKTLNTEVAGSVSAIIMLKDGRIASNFNEYDIAIWK
jgi:WD40 repeat protein